MSESFIMSGPTDFHSLRPAELCPSSQVEMIIPSLPQERRSPGRGSWLHRLQTSWAAHRGSGRARIRQTPASQWSLCRSAGSDARLVCSAHSLRSADRQTWTIRSSTRLILRFLCYCYTPHRGKILFPPQLSLCYVYSDYTTEENYTIYRN